MAAPHVVLALCTAAQSAPLHFLEEAVMSLVAGMVKMANATSWAALTTVLAISTAAPIPEFVINTVVLNFFPSLAA